MLAKLFPRKLLVTAALMGAGAALSVLFPSLAEPIRVLVHAIAAMIGG